jgi:hypothetical protein
MPTGKRGLGQNMIDRRQKIGKMGGVWNMVGEYGH